VDGEAEELHAPLPARPSGQGHGVGWNRWGWKATGIDAVPAVDGVRGAFFGCLYAAWRCRPTSARNHKLSRIESIVDDADAKVALRRNRSGVDRPVSATHPGWAAYWQATDVAGAACMTAGRCRMSIPIRWPSCNTPGSTGTPKESCSVTTT
jgi:hypothetical protein